MEGYTAPIDWKDYYYFNVCATPQNQQIQCNFYQNANGIFLRMDLQKAMET